MNSRVSVSELVSAGIRLRPAEAVAIVGEICRQRAARVLPGLPSPGVIRLTSHGEITIEGPVPAGEDTIARAGQLLEALLGDVDAPPEYRASGGLRLVIARARGTLDLPPFASLEDFCGALVRFSTLDARDTVKMLVAAYNDARSAEPEIPVEALADELAVVSLRQRRFEYAVWIAAPAAAAVLGYVLALPRAEPAAPAPQVHAAVERQATAPEPSAPVPAALPPQAATPPPVAPTSAEEHEPITPVERARLLRASAYSPAFASTGAVYFHEQHDGTSALKRADTVNGAVRSVTSILDDRSRNFHPRPSPDGKRIAFDSDRDGVRGVYVADADGGNVHRISGEGFASVPSWSPDGRCLAFVRAESSSPNVWNLWLADVDGGHLRRLTHHRVGQAWGGSWFPDGRRIAYSVESTLVILDLTTGDARHLSSPRPGHLVRTPAVSPDGTRIVFQVHHDGTWIADVKTGAMERVLTDPTAEEFTWAPDGRHVAYHSHRNGSWSVWVMPL